MTFGKCMTLRYMQVEGNGTQCAGGVKRIAPDNNENFEEKLGEYIN